MKTTLLIALASLLSFAGDAQIISGTIASYTFNNANANDDIGTNHGTVNGATLTSDRFGNANHAYHFDATNSAYISIPNHASNNFTNTQPFSISCWIKIDSNNSQSAVISKHSMPMWEGYALWTNNLTDPGYCMGAGTLGFYTASAALEDACANTLAALDYSHWKFITVSYGGTTNSSKLYVDGVLQSDIGSVSGPLNNAIDLIIGAGYDSMTGLYGGYFTGNIDDIGIYDHALNQLEVDSLFNAGNPVWPTHVKNEFETQSDIIISPNPAHGKIHLSQTCNLSICNIIGKRVLSQRNTNTVDINSLNEGIYILHLSSSEGKELQVAKIIIE